MMALALYKASGIWREILGLKSFALLKTLMRDQAVYFLACVHCAVPLVPNLFIVSSVILVSVIRIVDASVKQSTVLSDILNLVGSPALLSILGARLLFNTKEAGAKGLIEGTNCYSRSSASDIRFLGPSHASAACSPSRMTESEVIELGIP